MELIMGGKMAPIPSLFWKCSIIQRSQAARARRRQGVQCLHSRNLRTLSVILKKLLQNPGRGAEGTALSSHNSSIFACSGMARLGLKAQITDNGTTMARDQEDSS